MPEGSYYFFLSLGYTDNEKDTFLSIKYLPKYHIQIITNNSFYCIYKYP